MTAQLDATLEYIRSNFLSLEEFSGRVGVDPKRIEQLVLARCIPAHSYEISELIQVQSFFGERRQLNASQRYYSPALVELARRIERQSQTTPLTAIAESEKQTFFSSYQALLKNGEARANGFEEYFNPDGSLNEASLCPHLEQEWQHVLDGTYALCTPTSGVEDIVTKEVMAKKIKRITQDNTLGDLSASERAELLQALRQLNQACSEFAPDERKQSSRHQRIDVVLKQYGLKL